MGFDEQPPAPSAPACCAPSAPALEALSAGEQEVLAELQQLGLAEYHIELLGAGVKSRTAFGMIEEVDDLPDALPKLVKKQIIKRAQVIAEEAARLNAMKPISFTVHVVGENRQFTIEAKPSERLQDLRGRFDAHHVPTPHKVCFESTTITDATVLHDVNIVQGSSVFLIPIKSGPAEIFFKTAAGAVSTANVNLTPSFTVGQLRRMYAAEKDLHETAVRLSFDGVALHDDAVPLVMLHKEVVDGSVFRVA